MIERIGNKIENENKKTQTAFARVWAEEEGDSE